MTSPLTSAQRAIVERQLEERRSGVSTDIAQSVPVMLLYLLMGVVLGLFLGIVPEVAGAQGALLVCVTGGTLLGAAAGLLRATRIWRDRAEGIRVLLRDLDENRGETSVFEIRDAVRLGGEADHGPSYFLDIGTRRVLFLEDPLADLLGTKLAAASQPPDHDDWPQWERYWEEQTGFPRRTLKLDRTLHGRLLVGLECTGDRVVPSRRLDPDDYDAPLVGDGEVLETTLEELCEGLRVW